MKFEKLLAVLCLASLAMLAGCSSSTDTQTPEDDIAVETETETETDTETTENESVVESEPETETEPESEVEETESEAETETEAESESEAETETDAAAETEKDPEGETKDETKSEPDAKDDTTDKGAETKKDEEPEKVDPAVPTEIIIREELPENTPKTEEPAKTEQPAVQTSNQVMPDDVTELPQAQIEERLRDKYADAAQAKPMTQIPTPTNLPSRYSLGTLAKDSYTSQFWNVKINFGNDWSVIPGDQVAKFNSDASAESYYGVELTAYSFDGSVVDGQAALYVQDVGDMEMSKIVGDFGQGYAQSEVTIAGETYTKLSGKDSAVYLRIKDGMLFELTYNYLSGSDNTSASFEQSITAAN